MIRIEDDMGHGKMYHTGAEVAKELKLEDSNGKTIGRNKFYALLREHGILMENNEPYQYHINMDLVCLHQVRKGNYTVNMVLFSDRGVNYLKNKFKPMKKSEELMAMPENKYESRANVYYEHLAMKNNPSLDIFLDVCVDFFNNFLGDVDAMEELWEKMVDTNYEPTHNVLARIMKESMEKILEDGKD